MTREMTIFLATIGVLALAGVGSVAWLSAPPAALPPVEIPRLDHAAYHDLTHDPGAACTCEIERLRHGWCRHHGVGWVAGLRVGFADLYEALDAHGHAIDPASIGCGSCLDALATNGLCYRCGHGFVDGQLYASPLTFWLARGRIEDPARLACPTCRRHGMDAGWCDACEAGRLGPVVYEDRRTYDVAASERARLVRAIEAGRRCEMCGVTSFLAARCPVCGTDHASAADP